MVGERTATRPPVTTPGDVPAQDFVQLTLELSGSLDARTVIQRVLERSVGVASADRATLSSVRGDHLTMEAGVGWGEAVSWAGRGYDFDVVAQQPAVVEMLTTRQTVLAGPLSVENAQPEFREALARVRHTAVVPILADGEVAGMLVLSRYSDRAFLPGDIPTLTAFGARAGLALRNAQLYEEATAATQRLREAEATNREFMNITVHELRGPLTGIEGYTEMLIADTDAQAEPEVAQQLTAIRRQAEHARLLAEDLLILARLESDALGVSHTRVALRAVLTDAGERARARAALRSGTVQLRTDGDLDVLGDRDLVARILDNLLGNAIVYSSTPPDISVVAGHDGDDVVVRVQDTGVGVPEEDRERIFARFTRGSRAAGTRGTGLGLYLSRECARRMGGDLVLEEDARPVGSSFLLRLPAAG